MLNGKELRAILGKSIRFYRKQQQLSQAELAEKADISVTFLSKIELGVKFPTSDSLSGIANGLGVEVYELFRYDNSPVEQRDLFEWFKAELTQNVLNALDTTCKSYKQPEMQGVTAGAEITRILP